jgi:squalene-hopene/tetraprenyl-beta-curcumene cyclase
MCRIILAFLFLTVVSVCRADEDAQPAPPKVELQNQYEIDEITVPAAFADEPVSELSIERAAEHLDDGAVGWSRQRKCITCHTNGTYLFIRPRLSSSLGLPSAGVRQFFLDELAELEATDHKRLKTGTRPAQVIYAAAGLAEWDAHVFHQGSAETDAALRLMLDLQDENGAWTSLDCWPPFESSAYQEATMAAMAVGAFPQWLPSIQNPELLKRVDRLRTYLRDTEPPHKYAKVLKLWASKRFDGILGADEEQAIVSMILEQQQPDGGWSLRNFATPEQWGRGNRAERIRAESDFDSPPSDGHMTGLALIVLQQSEMNGNADPVRCGLTWLKENQRVSGRWWTRSLNTDKWHFITYSGTAYPLLALQLAGELQDSVTR